MSKRDRLATLGYTTSRTERLRALQRRLLWLDAKLVALEGDPTAGRGYLHAEREAVYWALELLGALVECHNAKWIAAHRPQGEL